MNSYFFFLYLMATLYVLAGFLHFIKPRPYLKIMPPWVPRPILMNRIAGMAEIVLGLGLFTPAYREVAAWGIILLLIAVFPANWHHYQISKGKGKWETLTLIRLPLQLLLIWWAFQYT